MTHIYKVIQCPKDPDTMEEINKITRLDAFRECNWCDFYTFDIFPELSKYITKEEWQLMATEQIDYIVFRLDC